MKYLVILIVFISTFATAQVTVGKFNRNQGDRNQTLSTLKITSPKEGDTLTNSKEITITWEGIDPNTPVDIDYLFRGGWVNIARNVTGLSYVWKGLDDIYNKKYDYTYFAINITESDKEMQANLTELSFCKYISDVPLILRDNKLIQLAYWRSNNLNELVNIWNIDSFQKEKILNSTNNMWCDYWGNYYSCLTLSSDKSKLLYNAYELINPKYYPGNSNTIDKVTVIWDMNTLKFDKVIRYKNSDISQVREAIFGNDNNTIISVHDKNTIRITNIQDNKIKKIFHPNDTTYPILSINILTKNKILIGLENLKYEIWDLSNFKLSHEFIIDNKEFIPMISYDKKYLISLSNETVNKRAINFINIDSSNNSNLVYKKIEFKSRDFLFSYNSFISNDNTLLAFNYGKYLYIYDISKSEPILLISKDVKFDEMQAVFTEDNKFLLITSNKGDNIKLNLNNSQEEYFGGHSYKLEKLAYIENTDSLISFTSQPLEISNSMLIWNIKNKNVISQNKIINNDDDNKLIDISKNNELLLLFGEVNDSLRYLTYNTKNNVKSKLNIPHPYNDNKDSIIVIGKMRFNKSNDKIYYIGKTSLESNLLYLRTYDIKQYRITNTRFIKGIDSLSQYLHGEVLYVSQNEQYFAILSDNKESLFICDIQTDNTIKINTLDNFSKIIFSNDDNYIITTDYSNRVRFWNVKTGQLENEYRGEKIYFSMLELSKNEEKLFAGNFSGVDVWNTNKGELLRRIKPKREPITAMTINEDGSKLFIGEEDGSIYIYNINDKTYLSSDNSYYFYFENPKSNNFDSLIYDTTSIDPTNNDKPLVMSPNPSSDKIDIAYTFDEEEGTASLFVYNVFGQVILSKEIPKTKTGKYTLNLKELPIGQYVVTISSPNSMQTQNFQIMR